MLLWVLNRCLKASWLQIALVVTIASGANHNRMVENPDYIDGPIVIVQPEGFRTSYLEKVRGKWTIRSKTSFADGVTVYNPISDPIEVPINRDQNSVKEYIFPSSDSIVAISDIEGNYPAFRAILESNQVIDSMGRWIFGKGHLVMLGDLFDRGPDVTPILWHLYKIEKEARRSGGRLHVLLGNHEIMIFQGDVRYAHQKYRDQMLSTGLSYDERYTTETVLGKWVREKPAVIAIGSILFSHAGLSPGLLALTMPVDEINKAVREVVTDQPINPLDSAKVQIIFGPAGPFWCRDWVAQKPSTEALDSILTFYNAKAMVIGHTVVPQVTQYYNGKVIAIDTRRSRHTGYGDMKALAIYEQNFYEIDESGELRNLD
ncbi:MAG: metallophosphoesterase [Saprospiraceae bacterium]|nr:metallophosphoesterase [Saprospiraceae bacterium]